MPAQRRWADLTAWRTCVCVARRGCSAGAGVAMSRRVGFQSGATTVATPAASAIHAARAIEVIHRRRLTLAESSFSHALPRCPIQRARAGGASGHGMEEAPRERRYVPDEPVP